SLARTRLAAGDLAAAGREIDAALADAERLGLQGLSCLGLGVRSLIRLSEGDAGRASADAEDALKAATALASRFHQAFTLRVAGAASGARGDGALAMDRLTRSLALFEEMNAELDAARTLVEMSRAAPADGDAGAWRGRARDIFTRLGALGDLARLVA